MKYKKILTGLSLSSVFLLTACHKADEPKTVSADQHQAASASLSVEKKSERDLMLEAVAKNKSKFLEGACKIEDLGEEGAHGLISGDLNHDRTNDFLYGYMKFFDCDSQVPAFEYAVFLGDKDGTFKLNNKFNAGMLDHIDRVEFNKIENNIIQGVAPQLEQKVQYILKDNQLNEVIDPNKKTIIQLGKAISANESPVAGDLDRMAYDSKEVECGEFFTEGAEKATMIDRYELRVLGDQVAITGVYGLTPQDQIQMLGKTITSATTLAQIKQLFKTGYEFGENKNSSEYIGSASEGAAHLKYDLMVNIRDKNMDDAYLLYFSKNKLIAVQYFIPC